MCHEKGSILWFFDINLKLGVKNKKPQPLRAIQWWWQIQPCSSCISPTRERSEGAVLFRESPPFPPIYKCDGRSVPGFQAR